MMATPCTGTIVEFLDLGERVPEAPPLYYSIINAEYDIRGDGGSANREPMVGGIAKAAKIPVCPCISSDPQAGGKRTKRISTDVTPKDAAIPVWAICPRCCVCN